MTNSNDWNDILRRQAQIFKSMGKLLEEEYHRLEVEEKARKTKDKVSEVAREVPKALKDSWEDVKSRRSEGFTEDEVSDEEDMHFLAEEILRDLRSYEEAKREEAIGKETPEAEEALGETAEHLAQMDEGELKPEVITTVIVDNTRG